VEFETDRQTERIRFSGKDGERQVEIEIEQWKRERGKRQRAREEREAKVKR